MTVNVNVSRFVLGFDVVSFNVGSSAISGCILGFILGLLIFKGAFLGV